MKVCTIEPSGCACDGDEIERGGYVCWFGSCLVDR